MICDNVDMAKKTDLRRLTHEQLAEFRRQAVAQVQSGISVDEVSHVMGVSRRALFDWLSLYRSGGWDALNASKRGGRKRKLDAKAMEWVYQTITKNQPYQMQLPFALWTAKLVAEVIKTELGIRLSRWSVARLLRQLGLSPQRPLFRAHQQDPERVEQWKQEIFPQIQKQAEQDKGAIYFLDESAVRSDHHAGTTWAEVGKTPVIKTTGGRFSLNVVGAISPRGIFRFMTFKGSMNAERFIEFLKRLLKDEKRPVHLVVDGHPVHRSRAVKRFSEATQGRLTLHFLPPYSPELNPIEQVWNHAKEHQVGKQVIAGPDHLKKLVLSAMRRIQMRAALVRAFFQHPDCAYTLLPT